MQVYFRKVENAITAVDILICDCGYKCDSSRQWC